MTRAILLIAVSAFVLVTVSRDNTTLGRVVPDAEAARIVGGCSDYESDESNGCNGMDDEDDDCNTTNGIRLQNDGDYSSQTVACGGSCDRSQTDDCN